MNYIKRAIEPILLDMAKYFPVIVLTGPRQSGKTTVINHLFDSFQRYSLEDLHVKELAEKDPIAFLNRNVNGMIIDEIQRAPLLLSYIQGIVDSNPDKRFILSGSSNFLLMKSVSQSLAGRAAILDLMPMSLDEVHDYASQLSLDELLFNGLYPAVCSRQNLPHYIYPSYVKTYLERDVRNLLNVNNISAFETFLKLCATRIGSLFKISQIANEVGVAVNTIKSWLSVLQASYIITLLPPYYENSSKRLTKTPKLYFNDTGIACYLLEIESPQQLSRDKMRGPLFENLIVMEAIKKGLNQGKTPNVYFYRDSNQNEIDLLIKKEGVFTGIEIKSSMTYHVDFENTLRKMPSYIKAPIGQRAVIYTGDLENTLSDIQLLNYRHLHNIL